MTVVTDTPPGRRIEGKPRVHVTRHLLPDVEARLSELFDVALNVEDRPMSRDELIAAMRDSDVLVPYSTAFDTQRQPMPYFDAMGIRLPDVYDERAGISGGQLVQMDIGTRADTGSKGKHQAQHQRDGGQHFKVNDGLEADAAHFLQVASAGNTADHYAEHNQPDEHLDQLDEAVAERFELGRVFRKGQPADDAEHQSENHLEED